MKKLFTLIATLAVVFSFATFSFAGQKNYGCGLGTMIFGGDQDSLLSQTFIAYLNGSSQIYGITTGTSECESFNGIVSNEKLNNFVADNMDNLATDIAKGQGEYLNTLAVLMEVSEDSRASFYGKLQSNFSTIYSSDSVTHLDVIKNIDSVVKS